MKMFAGLKRILALIPGAKRPGKGHEKCTANALFGNYNLPGRTFPGTRCGPSRANPWQPLENYKLMANSCRYMELERP